MSGEAEEDEVEVDEDVCGLCFEPGADKMSGWTGGAAYWPGEQRSETEHVHGECERKETERAHGELTAAEVRSCLDGVWSG